MKMARLAPRIAAIAVAAFLAPAGAQSGPEWSYPCASRIVDGNFSAIIQAIRPGSSGLNLSPNTNPYVTFSVSLPVLNNNIIDTMLEGEGRPGLSLDFRPSPGEPGIKIWFSFLKLDLGGAKTRDEADESLANLDCHFSVNGGASGDAAPLGVRRSSSDETWFASCDSRLLETKFAFVDVKVLNNVTGAIAYEGRFNASVPPRFMERIQIEGQRTLANARSGPCVYNSDG